MDEYKPTTLEAVLAALESSLLGDSPDKEVLFTLCKAVHSLFWGSWNRLPEATRPTFGRVLEARMSPQLSKAVYEAGAYERKIDEFTRKFNEAPNISEKIFTRYSGPSVL